MSSNETEALLKRKSYAEIEKAIRDYSTDALIELLKSSSIKVGDSASGTLNRRHEENRVAEAIIQGEFSTKDSKIRAINTINFGGKGNDLTDEALLTLVSDKNRDVADTALFSLIVLRRKNVVERLKNISVIGDLKNRVAVAITALEKENPRIYYPSYGGN